jgi:hypothetical protein
MAQFNKNTQDFLNQERTLFEVPMIANKNGEVVTIDNPFPVSLGSSSITISGEVVIPGTIEISNDEGNPIPTHAHLYDENDNEYTASNPLTIDGTVNIGAGNTIDVNILNEVSIGNTVSIGGTVSIGNTVDVSGTVNIGTMPEVEIKNDTGNPIPISKNTTVNSNSNPIFVKGTSDTSFFDPAQTDAFGRLRVSNPLTLFDSSHRYRDNNLWSGLLVGTGATVGFSTTEGLVNISIGTTAGCSVIRETTKVFSYQPGKSLLVLNTFVMDSPKENLRQRVGYFGADNGIYLQVSGIGSTSVSFVERSLSIGTETIVPQTEWNIDKLDGTGISGLTLDISKAQILWMDIEWLGLGTVRIGFVINGQFIHCHSFHHANIIQSTYITTASLPLRYEIANTGITTSSSNLKQVCSTVISEGGYELRGIQQAVSTPITIPVDLPSPAGTHYPVLSIRLKSSPDRLDAIVILTALSLMGIGNGPEYNWQVRASATTTGGTWVSAGADSAVEYKIDGGTVSGGRILASGFFSSNNQSQASVDILKEALFKFQLERNGLTGTPYELTLVCATNSAGADVFASLDWEEISR